jgi:hypothetical protein
MFATEKWQENQRLLARRDISLRASVLFFARDRGAVLLFQALLGANEFAKEIARLANLDSTQAHERQ